MIIHRHEDRLPACAIHAVATIARDAVTHSDDTPEFFHIQTLLSKTAYDVGSSAGVR
jgi:hypothetical protein